jgi:hypothetical protein
MLRVVPSRGRWLRDHPLDLAIVILTPPFLPPSLQAARVFRLLRLLRVVRAGSLAARVFSTEGVRDASVLALFRYSAAVRPPGVSAHPVGKHRCGSVRVPRHVPT